MLTTTFARLLLLFLLPRCPSDGKQAAGRTDTPGDRYEAAAGHTTALISKPSLAHAPSVVRTCTLHDCCRTYTCGLLPVSTLHDQHSACRKLSGCLPSAAAMPLSCLGVPHFG